MKYAYVDKDGIVRTIESRDIPIEQLYHADLLKQFKPISTGQPVAKGWNYSAVSGFSEPKLFEKHPITGEEYIPESLPVEFAQKVKQTELENNELKMQLKAETDHINVLEEVLTEVILRGDY